MTTSGRDDDAPWRPTRDGSGYPPVPPIGPRPRPAPPRADPPYADPPYADPPYSGPPPSLPPPPDWHPPIIVDPAAPRPLPAQDHDLLDLQEQSARTLTIGVAMLAGAIMLVMLFLLCGRALF